MNKLKTVSVNACMYVRVFVCVREGGRRDEEREIDGGTYLELPNSVVLSQGQHDFPKETSSATTSFSFSVPSSLVLETSSPGYKANDDFSILANLFHNIPFS